MCPATPKNVECLIKPRDLWGEGLPLGAAGFDGGTGQNMELGKGISLPTSLPSLPLIPNWLNPFRNRFPGHGAYGKDRELVCSITRRHPVHACKCIRENAHFLRMENCVRFWSQGGQSQEKGKDWGYRGRWVGPVVFCSHILHLMGANCLKKKFWTFF